MFQSLIIAILRETLHFLSKHPEFFKQEEGRRLEALESVKIPSSFKHALAEHSEKSFMKDLHLAVSFASGDQEISVKGSPFFKALAEFLAGPLASKMDLLDKHFYLISPVKRAQMAEELIKGETALANALRQLLSTRNYQELAQAIVALIHKVSARPTILIQSPREVEPEVKKEIRAHLTEEHLLNFPVYQINKNLIGGLRIFKDGHVVDHSWLSRVLRFTSLTAE